MTAKDRRNSRNATDFGKSQLHLGHLVDHKNSQRGAGAGLRTDDHLSLRGGKGILL
ncbi:type VI secretion system Vgr family protein [Glaciimonas sp. PAMC28666]|uniref:type VI secretion system Vgr family protein n=1 Tax=Glaciimonas sp. PAMC28666 TaxID=2807626 RepID=UPI00351C1E5D